jgi:hypothetical protein
MPTAPAHLTKDRLAYFVLDGLDDCDLSTRKFVAKELRMLQMTGLLHICVAKRLDPDTDHISHQSIPSTDRTVLMPDDNPDIEAYIDAELGSRVESGKLKLSGPVLILEIQQRLLEGSQGMFLWVALQIESHCSMQTDYDIRKSLEGLPKDLPGTYSRILRTSGGGNWNLQKRILSFLLAAFRDLTTEELREALSVIPGNTDWKSSSLTNDMASALACFGGLVSVDEEDKTVLLVHHSFKQFLLFAKGIGLYSTLTITSIHEVIFNTIVTYLNFGVFETQVSATVVPRLKMEALPTRIIRSSMSSSAGQSMALKLLQSRRMPDFDIGRTVADVSNRYNSNNRDTATTFHLHGYAKAYCMMHLMSISYPGSDCSSISYSFLARLVKKNIIDPNEEDATGQTILSQAAGNGDKSVVRVLLGSDSTNLDTSDQEGRTPLSWAAGKGHMEVVTFLADCGGSAKIDIIDRDGRTPLS